MAYPPTPDMPPAEFAMDERRAAFEFDQAEPTYEVQYSLHRESLPQFIDAANLQATDTVLDLGCGIGWNTHLAAPRCRYVIGIDISRNCCTRAIYGSHYAGLDNVAFAAEDIVSPPRLAQGIRRAKTETRQFINTPAVQDKNGRRLHNIASRVPDNVPLQFTAIFLCWVAHLIGHDEKLDFLRSLRDHFLAPGGRIIITWPSPIGQTATLSAGWGIVDPATGEYSAVGTAAKEYVGHRDNIVEARKDLRATA